MTTAKKATVAAAEPETVDVKAAEREAREAAKAEAHAAGLRQRDYERGYTERVWAGRTLYAPIGGGDVAFDNERDAIAHVAAARVQANLTGA